jgi:HEAT repeat protein
MEDATGVPESVACGEPLGRLFPDLGERGYLARMRRVAEGRGVEVLAPAFHQYLIACVPRDAGSRFARMRQHVTMAPLMSGDTVAGIVVTIEDVTPRLDRERRLSDDLESADEHTRLRAAEALAARGEAPALLAGSLADDSWRVRRVAVESVATTGGRDVIDQLLEEIRTNHRDPALLNSAIAAVTRTRLDVLPAILPMLFVDDSETRTYAALTLGLIADRRAVPDLLRLLDDADTNVRFHAIEALGRIGDLSAALPLAGVARSGDFFLSFAALDALAAIAEPAVVAELLPLLDDDSLSGSAIACLGAIGTDDVVAPLAARLAKPNADAGAIALALATAYERTERELGEGALVADLARASIDHRTTELLIKEAATADPATLSGIVIALSWLPSPDVDRLLASLLGHADVRYLAAEMLSRRGVGAAGAIEAMAGGESVEIRTLAAHALGRIGAPSSVPLLLGWLDDEPELIVAAAAALGAIGDRRAFAPLLEHLDHPESAVRQAVVSALNSVGHPQMEVAIARRLKHESPRVRESAARIAGYFGYGSCLRQMVELCDDADETVRRAVVEHLANFDERQAWSKIAETLRGDPSPSVRSAAARAMGQSTSAAALASLIAAANDPNLWVRYYVARSLGRRGEAHADALACLAERATRDRAVPVRVAAIEALGAIGSPSMLPVLIPIVQDAEPEVARAAATALAFGEAQRTADVLRYALERGDAMLQHAALETLGRQRAVGAVPEVASLARSTRDEAMAVRAVNALGAIGGADAIAQLVMLAGDRRLHEAAVTALANIGGDHVLLLRDALDRGDEHARRTIVDALSRMKHDSVAAVLAAVLDDPSPGIRVAASRALGRLGRRE